MTPPADGIFETPKISAASPGDTMSMPAKSKRDAASGSSFGSSRHDSSSVTTPIGTLMKKIQRQLTASTSQPPRIGPPIGPSSIGTPSTAITRPIRCGPAARVRIVMPQGISMPPPKPCRTRNPISVSMFHARPASIEVAARNSTIATM